MAKKQTTSKTVKKSAPKTSAKTRTSVASLAVDASTSSAQGKAGKNSKQALKIRRSYIVLVVIMLALGAFLYFARGIFVAAVVNGQPISRLAIIKETEKQSGKQALETIVRNTLIEQEARRSNVTITEKEIDDEVKKVEETVSKQGQKLDDVLVMQGLTREDLRKLIRLDKLVGKIVGRDIKVTDEEINKYLEENSELLPQDQTPEQLRKMAEDRLKQEKLNTKVQTWLESLHNKAKILYFVQY